MKILHYALGFPPYRTGGMTKFCIDLLIQQKNNGHQVILVWPGQMCLVLKHVSVKDRGIAILHGSSSGIRSYEIINPLPISYDEGIRDFSAFTKDRGKDAYSKLLDSYKPDVIHIHTLMGLHKSFLDEAKKRGIRLVFTAHDFFPICPKVTIFRHGTVCESVQSCVQCGVCNTTALGINKIRIMQSPIYRRLKDLPLVAKLRKHHRDGYLSERTLNDDAIPVGTPNDFKRLRSYYSSLLQLMDSIHYNSTLTKEVYESVFRLPNSQIISITHADVVDHRRMKKFSDTTLRIRYLGPYGRAKGFFYLRRHLIKYGMNDRIFV